MSLNINKDLLINSLEQKEPVYQQKWGKNKKIITLGKYLELAGLAQFFYKKLSTEDVILKLKAETVTRQEASKLLHKVESNEILKLKYGVGDKQELHTKALYLKDILIDKSNKWKLPVNSEAFRRKLATSGYQITQDSADKLVDWITKLPLEKAVKILAKHCTISKDDYRTLGVPEPKKPPLDDRVNGAVLSRKTVDKDQEAAEYVQFLRAHPQDFKFELGMKLLEGGDTVGASKYAQALFTEGKTTSDQKLIEKSETLYMKIAESLIAKGDIKGAEKYVQMFLKASQQLLDEAAPLYQKMALVQIERGNIKKADEYANTLFSAGRYGEVAKIAQALVEKGATKVAEKYDRLLIGMDRFEEAKGIYQQLVDYYDDKGQPKKDENYFREHLRIKLSEANKKELSKEKASSIRKNAYVNAAKEYLKLADSLKNGKMSVKHAHAKEMALLRMACLCAHKSTENSDSNHIEGVETIHDLERLSDSNINVYAEFLRFGI